MPHANAASAPATDTAALLVEVDTYIRSEVDLDDQPLPQVDRWLIRLAAALRASERELQSVDGVLARRPALAAINGRAARIEHAINVAKRCDDAEAERDRALAALALAEWKLTVRDSAGPRPWKEWEYDDQARDEGFIPRPSPKEASDA